MADQADRDLTVLQTEIKQLRADFGALAGTLGDVPGNVAKAVLEEMDAATEKVWGGIKDRAQSVGQGIEARPVAAALTAFGAGALIGLLFGRCRS